jgi:hypothetical protein
MIIVILLLLAFICFILATLQAPFPYPTTPAPYPPYPWIGAGLAFWVLTELIPHLAASHPGG